MHSNINTDINQLEEKQKGYQQQLQQILLLDENGNQIDVMQELLDV